MHRSLPIAFLCLSLPGVAQQTPPHHHAQPGARAKTGAISMLPVTTTSPKARAMYQQAMTDSMNFHLDRALDQWRAAVKLDPNFALANLMIAFRSQDPKEAKAALQRANTAVRKGSNGERLFVRWITGIREGNYLSGIAAMNDLIARYPFDKQLLSLAGNWLMLRYSYDRADALLDRALEVDPDYPPALNSAAYAHAQMGDFDNAIELMRHYAEVIPNEPNAQDSYAEILRQAGKFEAAVEHYQAALKIAPGFSIMGLADTYALKGDEERARAEYLRCNEHSEMSEDRILCRLQSPITYVWEKNYRAADEAFKTTAKWAHEHDLGFAEAQAYRMMAMYQEDDGVALKHLDLAAAVLGEHHSVSKSDHQDETARILRWRVVRATHAGNALIAAKALNRLQDMADRNPSEIVQRSYNAAAGAQLMADSKPADAIPHLREDVKDAFSMALLVKAYELTGDRQMAATERNQLANLHLPTIEYAMVMTGLRAAEAAH
jgi:tetratricopeptide (TPR) repeat protein